MRSNYIVLPLLIIIHIVHGSSRRSIRIGDVQHGRSTRHDESKSSQHQTSMTGSQLLKQSAMGMTKSSQVSRSRIMTGSKQHALKHVKIERDQTQLNPYIGEILYPSIFDNSYTGDTQRTASVNDLKQDSVVKLIINRGKINRIYPHRKVDQLLAAFRIIYEQNANSNERIMSILPEILTPLINEVGTVYSKGDQSKVISFLDQSTEEPTFLQKTHSIIQTHPIITKLKNLYLKDPESINLKTRMNLSIKKMFYFECVNSFSIQFIKSKMEEFIKKNDTEHLLKFNALWEYIYKSIILPLESKDNLTHVDDIFQKFLKLLRENKMDNEFKEYSASKKCPNGVADLLMEESPDLGQLIKQISKDNLSNVFHLSKDLLHDFYTLWTVLLESKPFDLQSEELDDLTDSICMSMIYYGGSKTVGDILKRLVGNEALIRQYVLRIFKLFLKIENQPKWFNFKNEERCLQCVKLWISIYGPYISSITDVKTETTKVLKMTSSYSDKAYGLTKPIADTRNRRISRDPTARARIRYSMQNAGYNRRVSESIFNPGDKELDLYEEYKQMKVHYNSKRKYEISGVLLPLGRRGIEGVPTLSSFTTLYTPYAHIDDDDYQVSNITTDPSNNRSIISEEEVYGGFDRWDRHFRDYIHQLATGEYQGERGLKRNEINWLLEMSIPQQIGEKANTESWILDQFVRLSSKKFSGRQPRSVFGTSNDIFYGSTDDTVIQNCFEQVIKNSETDLPRILRNNECLTLYGIWSRRTRIAFTEESFNALNLHNLQKTSEWYYKWLKTLQSTDTYLKLYRPELRESLEKAVIPAFDENNNLAFGGYPSIELHLGAIIASNMFLGHDVISIRERAVGFWERELINKYARLTELENELLDDFKFTFHGMEYADVKEALISIEYYDHYTPPMNIYVFLEEIDKPYSISNLLHGFKITEELMSWLEEPVSWSLKNTGKWNTYLGINQEEDEVITPFEYEAYLPAVRLIQANRVEEEDVSLLNEFDNALVKMDKLRRTSEPVHRFSRLNYFLSRQYSYILDTRIPDQFEMESFFGKYLLLTEERMSIDDCNLLSRVQRRYTRSFRHRPVNDHPMRISDDSNIRDLLSSDANLYCKINGIFLINTSSTINTQMDTMFNNPLEWLKKLLESEPGENRIQIFKQSEHDLELAAKSWHINGWNDLAGLYFYLTTCNFDQSTDKLILEFHKRLEKYNGKYIERVITNYRHIVKLTDENLFIDRGLHHLLERYHRLLKLKFIKPRIINGMHAFLEKEYSTEEYYNWHQNFVSERVNRFGGNNIGWNISNQETLTNWSNSQWSFQQIANNQLSVNTNYSINLIKSFNTNIFIPNFVRWNTFVKGSNMSLLSSMASGGDYSFGDGQSVCHTEKGHPSFRQILKSRAASTISDIIYHSFFSTPFLRNTMLNIGSSCSSLPWDSIELWGDVIVNEEWSDSVDKIIKDQFVNFDEVHQFLTNHVKTTDLTLLQKFLSSVRRDDISQPNKSLHSFVEYYFNNIVVKREMPPNSKVEHSKESNFSKQKFYVDILLNKQLEGIFERWGSFVDPPEKLIFGHDTTHKNNTLPNVETSSTSMEAFLRLSTKHHTYQHLFDDRISSVLTWKGWNEQHNPLHIWRVFDGLLKAHLETDKMTPISSHTVNSLSALNYVCKMDRIGHTDEQNANFLLSNDERILSEKRVKDCEYLYKLFNTRIEYPFVKFVNYAPIRRNDYSEMVNEVKDSNGTVSIDHVLDKYFAVHYEKDRVYMDDKRFFSEYVDDEEWSVESWSYTLYIQIMSLYDHANITFMDDDFSRNIASIVILEYLRLVCEDLLVSTATKFNIMNVNLKYVVKSILLFEDILTSKCVKDLMYTKIMRFLRLSGNVRTYRWFMAKRWDIDFFVMHPENYDWTSRAESDLYEGRTSLDLVLSTVIELRVAPLYIDTSESVNIYPDIPINENTTSYPYSSLNRNQFPRLTHVSSRIYFLRFLEQLRRESQQTSLSAAASETSNIPHRKGKPLCKFLFEYSQSTDVRNEITQQYSNLIHHQTELHVASGTSIRNIFEGHPEYSGTIQLDISAIRSKSKFSEENLKKEVFVSSLLKRVLHESTQFELENSLILQLVEILNTLASTEHTLDNVSEYIILRDVVVMFTEAFAFNHSVSKQ